MGKLDHYDPEELVKWHQFVFRADVGRVAELRVALEPWITWRDRGPLEQFRDAYYPAWLHDEAIATIAVVPGIFAPLVEHAASFDVDPVAVRARIAAIGTRMTRSLHARVVGFPDCLWRLRRMREINAPAEIIDNELQFIRATLALDNFTTVGDLTEPASELDFRTLFETAIELAVRDPWSENAGLDRMYEVISHDFPMPFATRLVSPSWPIHHDNLEGREGCVYGLDGFPIGVIEAGVVEARTIDDAIACEPAAEVLSNFALDRLARQLEDEGVDVADDDDSDLDYDEGRRKITRQLAPDRVVVVIDEVNAEWRARKTALVAALRDLAAGTCVLLVWDAKNPSL